jgi:crotonobetainyl-CoA:carnitine CoA-transferase CaiB-like acyl-CoA transferase
MNKAAKPSTGERPLTGLRVIDLTTVLMGPFATQWLGDMGADIIKVEAPGGDGTRDIGPSRHPKMGSIFLNVNRSKRSVVLDLKQPAGRDAVVRLCTEADVVVFNIRPQAMKRLGLSYETLSAANPRLIYVGLVGYDPRGPYASRPAYDDLIQGAVGLPALSRQAGGDEPRYVPLTIADYFVGMSGVTAMLGAVIYRERTGFGQAITVPMFETMTQLVLAVHLGGRAFEPAEGKPGYSRLLAPQRRPYRTKDGYVCALIYNDKQCESFFRLIGKPEIFASDPRFSSLASRTRHIGELYQIVEDHLVQRTTDEWLTLLEEADIPVMPMHNLDSLIDDPHLAAIGLVDRIDHPTEGTLRSVNVPSQWSRSQPGSTRPAPRLGEQTVDVLREVGYSEAEIDALVTDKVAFGLAAEAVA